ncbi:type II toxin-antitoxin system HicB family antitoxin [Aurantimonas sp. MSK8Z-1]|uniref:type II toxin-antitoxin system HicB family antitoxin n=1 Tax=Mangrovibrevibacter kandeliae TaxID=2968473 RepID=UPI0021191DEF|nr:type II toxin-antitoxin system HicB family antitoxin [Aurantimonas sp. MSK8Z-1]MCW4114026.1 type II toxin-antitoxin system HicB family antitoxin [Aurantimonas sp. MSK8Z-1]
MRFVYPARLEVDPDGGLLVTFRDVPEAITSGETRDEALVMGSQALGLALRGYSADRRSLPVPSKPAPDEVEIPVPVGDGLKLALITAYAVSGLAVDDFSRRLDTTERDAALLLDPDHLDTIEALQHALARLGQRFAIETIAA